MSARVSPEKFPDPELDTAPREGEAQTVLAGGCFWCVEAVYAQLDGVIDVTNGYAGGTKETADYRTVCGGRTNHAEVVRVRYYAGGGADRRSASSEDYDPAKITFGQILKMFFSIAHDPTQKDRQGNDVGRQYRSAIFYADEEQKRVAEAYIRQLDGAKVFDKPIVTELTPLEAFYEAEPYHRNYAALHSDEPYIRAVALPKVEKLRTYFADRLKRSGVS